MVAVSPATVTEDTVLTSFPSCTNPAETVESTPLKYVVAKGSLATLRVLAMSIFSAFDMTAVTKSLNRSYPAITCCCSAVHLDVLVGDGEELALAFALYVANPEGLSLPQALNPSSATAITDTDITERQGFTCAILP
jgi:hypothetical protein